MEPNTLKWPQFDQLGRDFYEQLKPSIDQLASGADELDDEAQQGLMRLQCWLDSPCVATVKLDGTNVGVEDAGVLVGRNAVISQGETYQKVDVWQLLSGYSEKAARLRTELASAAEKEAVARTMLYGELVVNSKYNYTGAGIFKQWLCFGVVVSPGADESDEAASRLANALRRAGFNARARNCVVTLTPNEKLAALLKDLEICTVSDVYRPAGNITEAQWAEHDGQGSLPYFHSLRQLLLSQWAQRFLLPSDGFPLGEGLVVACEGDGRLFKLKHAGEELGKVPDQLGEAVATLRGHAGSSHLPQGLLEVFERLLLVATTKITATSSPAPKPKTKGGPQVDGEAIAVWESTLTKFDCLESVFERGDDAQKLMQAELISQVAKDLVKDYGANERDAQQRAKRLVMTEMGKRYGAWKKSHASTPDS